jgi:F-type H+-transporting ATPase subunit delta
MSILAGRYVDALFDVAQGRGQVEPVAADLARLSVALGAAQGRARLLDPRLSAERKKALLLRLAPDMHELTSRFLDLVLAKKRAAILPLASARFHQRVLDASNTVEGMLETARPIGAAEVEGLAAAAGRAVGKQVRLTVVANPDLLGGVRMTVGHRMFDGSAATSLEGLRRRLLSAPVG